MAVYFLFFFSVLLIQPAEMSLEEIESRIGSLVQSDTITQLKSAVWKERLEGWLSSVTLLTCFGDICISSFFFG